MTITHPHHPLRGQLLPLVKIYRGLNPKAILGLPDGSHIGVPLENTDLDPASSQRLTNSHYHDIECLRKIAQLLEQLRAQRDGLT